MDEDSPRTFESLIEQGRALLHSTHDPLEAHQDFDEWDRAVAQWLDKNFLNAGLSATWSSVSVSDLVTGRQFHNDSHAWWSFRDAVQRRLVYLGQLGKRMPGVKQASNDVKPVETSSRVFLVHGHDEAARETVARFLEKLGLTPIILHEQPSRGKTVIEKFEAHSSVSFAVVLLTPDDLGRSKTDTALRPRARQNVILELGYFCGTLTRSRVCALVKDDVDVPSDYIGVVYIKWDERGAWRLALAREMQVAGLPVDLNMAVS